MKNTLRTLVVLTSFALVILFGATSAFAQVAAAPPVNTEDIQLSISWHLMLVIFGAVPAFFIGFMVGRSRADSIRKGGGAAMIAFALLMPSMAQAQEAQLPTIPSAATLTAPATPTVTPPAQTATPTRVATPDTVNDILNTVVATDTAGKTISLRDAIGHSYHATTAATKTENTVNTLVYWMFALNVIGVILMVLVLFRINQLQETFGAVSTALRTAVTPAATVTTTTTVTDPAADTVAPAATTTGAGAHGIAILLLTGAGLLGSAALAQAQTLPDAPITKISPIRLNSGATTKVTIVTSTPCATPQATFGQGITAKDLTSTATGFTMNLEVTPVKTDGWTRWVLNCGGTNMAAPTTASFYVIGSELAKFVNDTTTARLRNVTDATARRRIDELKKTVDSIPTSYVTKTQMDATLIEVNAALTSLLDRLNQRITALEESVTASVTTIDQHSGAITDLRNQVAGQGQAIGVLAQGLNSTTELLENEKKSGGFLNLGSQPLINKKKNSKHEQYAADMASVAEVMRLYTKKQ